MDIDQIYTPPTPPPIQLAPPNAPRANRTNRTLRVEVPDRNNPRAHPIFQLLLDNNQ
jgi:hypothetical protein